MQLGVEDLDDLARGCAILGAGGGGDIDAPLIQAKMAVAEHGPVRVVDADDLSDDALILPLSGWGAPTVGIEKLGSGREGAVLRSAVERWFGTPVAAVMAGEIGGGNGVQPVAWAAEMNLPLVDADGMGRAFPEGPQVAMHVAGLSPSPVFFADEHGDVVTIEPVDGDRYERLARTVTIAFGGSAIGADFVMTAAVARTATVRGTVTQALVLGRAAAQSGSEGILRASAGFRIIEGKLSEVERRTTEGFARGHALVTGVGPDIGTDIRIHIQNEYLLATAGDRPVAMVPDLIVVLDATTGVAIPTELLRYGQRVVVAGIPCAPVWRTAGGLAVVGPGAFGFPFEYEPVEALHGA
jgi:DUF917 family protein